MRVNLGITSMFNFLDMKEKISNFVLYISAPRGKELSNPDTPVKITADIWFITDVAENDNTFPIISKDFVANLTVDLKGKKFILERKVTGDKLDVYANVDKKRTKMVNSAKNLNEVFQAIERKLHDQA